MEKTRGTHDVSTSSMSTFLKRFPRIRYSSTHPKLTNHSVLEKVAG